MFICSSLSFQKGNDLEFFLVIILLGEGPDGIRMREREQKQEIRCQEEKGEKSLEKLLCAPLRFYTLGFYHNWAFEICPSPDSTKHTVLKGNLCSNSPDRKRLLDSLNPIFVIYKGKL